MPEPAPKKRLALPRELRLILSLGSVIFVLGYLVLPQFGPARSSVHLLATVNPVLVGPATLRTCETSTPPASRRSSAIAPSES